LRFEQASSVGIYRGLLQDLVIRMKNQHDEPLAVQLGYLLALQASRSDFAEELDLVVPVPTHWWRRFERGFHAAEVLAETFAKTCQLPFSRRLARCVRSTKKQGTLSTPGRFSNVRGAFGIQPKTNVSGLTIFLVDDVMTSGATASELARLLIRAGAAKVYVGVIARGARVS
jgi:ComF family protein